MSIAVHIPRGLREYCRCPEMINITADSVVAALVQLQHEYPSLYTSVCDETGRVRQHIHLFVNSDMVPVHEVGGLEMPLHPGDELTVWQAVSGG